MHRTNLRPLLVGCALALTPLTAACGADTVSPLPVRTAAPSASGLPADLPVATATSAAPTAGTTTSSPRARPARPKPTKTRTTPPKDTDGISSCRGAVRYDLDLQNNELALIKSMCFASGGVLRLQGIGPGLVTVDPASLVSQSYEGGVVDIRFVRKGTVDVKIPQDDRTYTITVVIK
jgi:hypothetical protein